jgi:phage-related protein (TIGR01555 family)
MADRYDGYTDAVLGQSLRGPQMFDASAIPNAATSQIFFRNDVELVKLYLEDGLARRIVDGPANDAMAKGFEIEGDDENHTIANEHDRLKTRLRINSALRLARLYGGSVVMLIVDDGGLLPDPLNEQGIKQIKELKVFDASQVWPAPNYVYLDPLESNYGTPSVYQINSPYSGVSFYCHESRLLFFSGLPVPQAVARMRHNGLQWRGASVLDGVFDDLIRYTNGLQWAERMLERKQQAVYTMEGLANMISNGLRAEVAARVNLVDMVRSLLNTVVIDGGTAGVGGDKYEVRELNVAGVPLLINEMQLKICADTGIPATVLFGRSPAGHNSTGESDMESYYRLGQQMQSNDAEPAITRLTDLILVQTEFNGSLPETWKVKWHALWIPSEKDQADAEAMRGQGRLATAQAADTYMAAGVLTNVEVRDDLIEQDQYGIMGVIDQGDLEAMQPPPPVIVAPVSAPGAPSGKPVAKAPSAKPKA